MTALVACHTAPCAGQAIADHAAHQQWHSDQRAAEPTGPLEPVLACSGCSALVVDINHHATVCGTGDTTDQPIGPQIAAWLDTIDLDQLDQDVAARSSFDDSIVTTIVDQLKRYATA